MVAKNTKKAKSTIEALGISQLDVSYFTNNYFTVFAFLVVCILFWLWALCYVGGALI